MVWHFGLEVFDAVVLLFAFELVAPRMITDDGEYSILLRFVDEIGEIV